MTFVKTRVRADDRHIGYVTEELSNRKLNSLQLGGTTSGNHYIAGLNVYKRKGRDNFVLEYPETITKGG